MTSKNPRPSQSIKRLVFVVGSLFAMALTAGIWWGEGVAENDQGEPAHWLPVNTAPLSQRIDLIGKIEPLATRILTAPYDGDVKDYLVEPGLQVESGQTLLSMDPTLLETRLREALALQLKARRTVQELRNWSTGSQVMRARRVLRSSEMQISNTQRKLSISQDLFQRGIIARDELNDLEQQSKAQQLDLAAAREELQNVLNEGSGEFLGRDQRAHPTITAHEPVRSCRGQWENAAHHVACYPCAARPAHRPTHHRVAGRPGADGRHHQPGVSSALPRVRLGWPRGRGCQRGQHPVCQRDGHLAGPGGAQRAHHAADLA